jgi:hypothetical protein
MEDKNGRVRVHLNTAVPSQKFPYLLKKIDNKLAQKKNAEPFTTATYDYILSNHNKNTSKQK